MRNKKEKPIRFVVPLIPPSVNMVYKKSRSGIVYKTGEAKEYEKQFNLSLKGKFKRQCEYDKKEGIYKLKKPIGSNYYELSIIIYFKSLHSKAGKILKLDSSNHVKIVEDCIEDFFGYNDKCNFRVVVEKRECECNPRVVCKLRQYRENETKKIKCNCKLCRRNKGLNNDR